MASAIPPWETIENFHHPEYKKNDYKKLTFLNESKISIELSGENCVESPQTIKSSQKH